ncbi:CoA-binding protein [Archangium minus]|uniref:CoA-binding protein n=1 Tax=Archangium minus TaxID=83450 RepID=A0ABY9X401_9BACT|nr:CoA-binding protein [Archangium minus]
MNWKDNLLTDDARIHALLESSRRIAVLGIKSDAEDKKPAHAVPRYLQKHGYDIIPVPVKDVGPTVLGQKPYHSVAEVPGPIDIVEVFRKPEDIGPHVDDLLAKKPRAVWFQLGIRNDAAAEQLARAGIQVVQDRCMKIELSRLTEQQGQHWPSA